MLRTVAILLRRVLSFKCLVINNVKDVKSFPTSYPFHISSVASVKITPHRALLCEKLPVLCVFCGSEITVSYSRSQTPGAGGRKCRFASAELCGCRARRCVLGPALTPSLPCGWCLSGGRR